MILTLKELANYLRVNERTILRMQKAGQITGIKVGGQWRFNGSQIDALFFPDGPLSDPTAAVPLNEFTPTAVAVPASRLVNADRMVLDMKAETGSDAIDELVDVIVKRNLCLDAGALREAVHAREALLSTGVGNGIAIPHPRDPIPTVAEPTVIVVGRAEKGIDFGAADSTPVSLFFLICSQTVQAHLNVLGRLAHLCTNENTTDGMKKTADPEQFMREVLKAERADFLTAS